ncbi:hypothetical protein PMIN07_005689 [Paraphaeosphaeria minitans]
MSVFSGPPPLFPNCSFIPGVVRLSIPSFDKRALSCVTSCGDDITAPLMIAFHPLSRSSKFRLAERQCPLSAQAITLPQRPSDGATLRYTIYRSQYPVFGL